jgi:hypothetical protein
MEQLERASRYLSRLRYAYEGIQEPSAIFSIDNPKDDCISFFLHCYHIKDWVQQLYCSTKAEKKEVENFINANQALKVCADLCNGSKHYKLRSADAYRSGEPQTVSVIDHQPVTYITGSGGMEVHTCTFSIESDSASYDALQLAERCMVLWNEYLAKHHT